LATNIDGKTVLASSVGIALRTIAYSDSVSELWFGPAGTERGLVSGVSGIGYLTGTPGTATLFKSSTLNEGQRNNMYKYNTNLNPITFIPGVGIVVFGQKTSASVASARDRINVERMIMYIRRQLRKNLIGFLFRPNDALTQGNVKSVADSFLGNILARRGLVDFLTICDNSNNTPDVVDRNELVLDIALKPTKAAEFLYIPIRIVSSNAQL